MRCQLVGVQKNVDLFGYLGVRFLKLMHSCILTESLSIFPVNFIEKADQISCRISKCSEKVTSNVTDSFRHTPPFEDIFRFSQFSHQVVGKILSIGMCVVCVKGGIWRCCRLDESIRRKPG